MPGVSSTQLLSSATSHSLINGHQNGSNGHHNGLHNGINGAPLDHENSRLEPRPSGGVCDQDLERLAVELHMLRENNGSGGESMAMARDSLLHSDNPLVHPFPGQGSNGSSSVVGNGHHVGHGGSLEDLKMQNGGRKSQNMTECVPVPTSEHVAEIVGRQGKVFDNVIS